MQIWPLPDRLRLPIWTLQNTQSQVDWSAWSLQTGFEGPTLHMRSRVGHVWVENIGYTDVINMNRELPRNNHGTSTAGGWHRFDPKDGHSMRLASFTSELLKH